MGRKIKNATYRNYAGISENLASRDLKMLVDKRILAASGDKRGRQYAAAKILHEASDRAYQPFKVPEESEAQLQSPAQQRLPGIS
jgi:hypothetical protein